MGPSEAQGCEAVRGQFRQVSRYCVVLAALAAVACTPKSAHETPARHMDHENAVSASPARALDASASAPVAAKPPAAEDLLLSSTETMRALEQSGYDLGTMLGDPAAHDAEALSRGANYKELAGFIEADIATVLKADKGSGVGMAFGHRVFDARYLQERTSRWELIGVSQRFDRDSFHPGRCGETRFIYRLSYDKTIRGTRITSRLPATAALSFWNLEEGDPALDGTRCREASERWRNVVADRDKPSLEKPSALAGRFKAVELNVQRVRWPSTTRGDMAGHAEYILRSLERSSDGHLIEGTLENTPDIAKATADKAFRERLRSWLIDPRNNAAVAHGRVVLPREFLATRATSVTPLGLGRLQNRPFSAIFRPAEIAQAGATEMSPSAMLRRLDEMSCQGCHASRSIAGFHFLGEETAAQDSVNAVLVGRSPHLLEDLERRVADFPSTRKDGAPRDIPFPERGRTGPVGERGERCALLSSENRDPAFAEWRCAEGLTCQRDTASSLDGLGACAYPTPHLGDACEVGRLSPSSDPHRDRVGQMANRACPASAVCESNHVGFPGGACAGSCATSGEGIACGAIPFLVGFNACLGKANGVPFEECVKSNARPAAVQACDDHHACREDYICARTSEGKGACMPPYFLFQLRVDGHP